MFVLYNCLVVSEVQVFFRDKKDLDSKPDDDMKRQVSERYGLTLDYEDEEPGMYDDEYDDTYDTNNIGAFDADSADELTVRR